MSGPLMRGLFVNFSKLCLKNNLTQFIKPKITSAIPNLCACREIKSNSHLYNLTKLQQEEVQDTTKIDNQITTEIISKIKEQVAKKEHGRLFAVVHVAGKQFKITSGDIIIIEGYWPPTVGDQLTLDKILLIGGADFSFIGRPLIQDGLAEVKATVVEKSISHTKTHFRKRKRKQYMRINFYRVPQTMLRINSIEIIGELNNPARVEGLERHIF
ncbi:39S ribosomal protein L21, mitochondrial [Chrysoperla carnea]|uniref:39S ribosomal protein L21, mitochondrial n=1 Tax=Chrysoperla carnea TaxID=189513 RepID=UPI001D0958E1|nr:39S ribosomal protein L21, mitochondrial [Chrysoperla carnea]